MCTPIGVCMRTLHAHIHTHTHTHTFNIHILNKLHVLKITYNNCRQWDPYVPGCVHDLSTINCYYPRSRWKNYWEWKRSENQTLTTSVHGEVKLLTTAWNKRVTDAASNKINCSHICTNCDVQTTVTCIQFRINCRE